jgi:hypothetical protein
MMTTKSAKRQFKAFKKMAGNRYDSIGTNEKMAGAAVLGVVIGVASALCRSLFDGSTSPKVAKAGKKPTA